MEALNIPAICSECGEKEFMPYECKFCGQKFCAEHRLPENHNCVGLEQHKEKMKQEGRMFEKKEVRSRKASESTFLTKYLSPFKENVAYLFLALIIINFLIQQTLQVFDPALSRYIYQLTVTSTGSWINMVISRPWTLITSIFGHYGATHLLINGIVLFFFGPQLERLIGSKRFVYLFIGAGILAGLIQVIALDLFFLPNTTFSVLGASGAIAAVLGAQTIFTPRMKILLMFIPMELWLATLFFVLMNIAFVGRAGEANLAHLVGITIGAVVAYYLKDKIRTTGIGQSLQFGDRRRRF